MLVLSSIKRNNLRTGFRAAYFIILIILAAILTCLLCSCTAPDQSGSSVNGDQPVLPFEANIPFALMPEYRSITEAETGPVTFELSSGSITAECHSTFYGPDSAIRRRYIQFGRYYKLMELEGKCPELEGDIAIADFNGDATGDIVRYRGGKLSIITVIAIVADDTIFREERTYYPNTDNGFMVTGITDIELGPAYGDNIPAAAVSLAGAADFDGDGYCDLLFAGKDALSIYYGSSGGFSGVAFRLPERKKGIMRAGDIDGDGTAEIVIGSGYILNVYRNNGTKEKPEYVLTSSNGAGPRGGGVQDFFCADMNSDRMADAVYLEKAGGRYRIRILCSSGDGRFGTDRDNKNLYSVFTFDEGIRPVNITAGDISGNGMGDLAGLVLNGGSAQNSVFFGDDDLAYDYSLFGMKIGDEYRLYSGCRWDDANFKSGGDHVMLSTSSDGIHWRRYPDAPMFYLGWELGETGWWVDNTLEPEVVYVDGVYHMLWQCTGVTPGGYYGDKIGYASSSDGINWIRKTDEPAVVCDDPEIGFNHEEILYVADDPDGKPFWLYTGHFENGTFKGYVRIRSADPSRFLFSESENTSGFSQIGNQLAYFDLPGGRRIFARITFLSVNDGVNDPYTVPTLQFSDDGLNFTGSSQFKLAGVDQSDPRNAHNRLTLFLGLVTENGTGRILPNEDGSFTFFYLATTANGPGGYDIFLAEGGAGSATLTFGAE